jgi:hypothetical protein
MLQKEQAIKIEKQLRKTGGPRTVYHFACSAQGCAHTIRVRSSELPSSKGLCSSHAQQKRPYESIYNRLHQDHRQIPVLLTYEEYLSFTKIKNCYYCNASIPWTPFSFIEGSFNSCAYFLDRKDNNGPYSKENCVVCCTRCNNFKSSLDYNDFIILCNLISENFKQKINSSLKGGGSCGA